jgi:hypothetical protein
MRRRIIRRSHLIRTLSDNLSVSHNHRAKRTATPRLNPFNRQLNRPRHERIAQVLSPPVHSLAISEAFSQATAKSPQKTIRTPAPNGKYMPGKRTTQHFFRLELSILLT